MDDKGVYAIARSIWESPAFDNEPYTQREAWMWLVGAAAWNERRIRGNGGPVSLARGEFCFSVRFLEERWQWSKSRVARFIKTLEKRDMIRDTSRDNSQVYSITKYNDFQVVGLPKRDSNRDTSRDASGTAAGQQRDKEETLKHSNIEKEESISSPAVADEPTQAIEAYNAVAEELGWPVAQRITPSRKSAVRARMREVGGLDGWRAAMARARASPFLRGDSGRDRAHEKWSPNLDFFLQQSSFTKLMEGQYDDRTPAAGDRNTDFLRGVGAAAAEHRGRSTG